MRLPGTCPDASRHPSCSLCLCLFPASACSLRCRHAAGADSSPHLVAATLWKALESMRDPLVNERLSRLFCGSGFCTRSNQVVTLLPFPLQPRHRLPDLTTLRRPINKPRPYPLQYYIIRLLLRQKLPEANKKLLRLLTETLARLCKPITEGGAGCDPKELAAVMGPVIFRIPEGTVVGLGASSSALPSFSCSHRRATGSGPCSRC